MYNQLDVYQHQISKRNNAQIFSIKIMPATSLFRDNAENEKKVKV
jgi:hypothetical protein